MTNYISQIDKARSIDFKLDVIDLYNRTGKDGSKFFPLLNYAAMLLLRGRETEHKKAALKWIGENINYFIVPIGTDATNGFTITKMENAVPIKGEVILLGESYSIGMTAASQHINFFYMLRSEACGPNKSLISLICPFVVKSVICSISDSLGEAIKSRKNDIESFPSVKDVMRLMKDYRHSGDGDFHMLPKIADMKAQSEKRYATFPVITRENPFDTEGKCICRYDRESKECILFNGKSIMGLPDSIDVLAAEPDDSTALEILYEYADGICRIKRAVDEAEKQRNALLALI